MKWFIDSYLVGMNKILLLFALLNLNYVSAQSEEFTWESIHKEHIEWMERMEFRSRYKGLLSHEHDSEVYARKRLNYAWHLGKLEDVYVYLPKLFEFIHDEDLETKRNIIYNTFNIDDVALTEWRRNGEMLKRVLQRFEDNGDIQKYLTPILLFVEHMTGQWTSGTERARTYLESYSDSATISNTGEIYLRMLHEIEDFDAAIKLSREYYEATGEVKFLQSYCNAVHSKGDAVAYLLLEDTIRKHGFYFQYFELMDLHMERGDDEALHYYLNWFNDSLTVDRWTQMYEIETNDGRYRFASYHIKLVADYYLTRDKPKACELYKQILEGESKALESKWDQRQEAMFYLAKVGTESEVEFMELWARNRRYRDEFIEACEFEVNICE